MEMNRFRRLVHLRSQTLPLLLHRSPLLRPIFPHRPRPAVLVITSHASTPPQNLVIPIRCTKGIWDPGPSRYIISSPICQCLNHLEIFLRPRMQINLALNINPRYHLCMTIFVVVFCTFTRFLWLISKNIDSISFFFIFFIVFRGAKRRRKLNCSRAWPYIIITHPLPITLSPNYTTPHLSIQSLPPPHKAS